MSAQCPAWIICLFHVNFHATVSPFRHENNQGLFDSLFFLFLLSCCVFITDSSPSKSILLGSISDSQLAPAGPPPFYDILLNLPLSVIMGLPDSQFCNSFSRCLEASSELCLTISLHPDLSLL